MGPSAVPFVKPNSILSFANALRLPSAAAKHSNGSNGSTVAFALHKIGPWLYADPMRTLAEDTSLEAERVLIQLWRQATPARKFALVLDTTRAMQQFMLAGLCERYPGDSPDRLRYRCAELWLGSELAQQAYGAMPDDP